ncbi:MAG: DNA topoisomerase IV subunit A [Bacilli bacterium]|nr:DNA topoisomerase IV subunit A [Bacilli bacterium]
MKEVKEAIEDIYEYALEEIMGQRFGSYSKYIIQDRAIPDVRDGLKPVQRRIIYSMHKEHNTYDKPYRKSAKTVGDVIGNYHPHGDTSIYEAMVRMSQDWKLRIPYIDMHGNNGSIDGDSPAAYRYTEARLSKFSNELVRDLEKDTVEFAPNFDDTVLEPTVLPARYPNLLVNGTNGISAGFATNIPPHNLGEIIDATIKRIDSPNCHLDTLMDIVKGPDFPTGGIVEAGDGIRKAYETGKGKIFVKARTNFEESKGKVSLIITEIPYEVNKALLVRKIDEIIIDKKIDGILELIDESDREGLRIAIDLKKDCNKEMILNYLLKNTELQISFNFNMIAIVNRAPKQLGLAEILDAYIVHQREVILRRTKFDLDHAKARLHIVEGLIRCLSILDEVIKTIRASKNRQESKENLVAKFGFSPEQAEAIITLQLYRLSNTDVTLLEEEMKELQALIAKYELILKDENELKSVMKEELRAVKKEFAEPRKTDIKEEITDIKIDSTEMIAKEDVIVALTKDGYIKRTSQRSYSSSNNETPQLKDGDYIIGMFELNTLDTVLVFTSLGNYLYIPVHVIPALVWKDQGKHVSNIVKLEQDEQVISVIPIRDFNAKDTIVVASENGMIKKTSVEEFKTLRYTKPICCMKLKDKDKIVNAFMLKHNEIFVATEEGYGLWFDQSEIPCVGLKASGVKSINLKGDKVVSVSNFDVNEEEYVSVVTAKGTGKRIKINEFDKSSRAKRGLMLLREVKSNPYKVLNVFVTPTKNILGLKANDIEYIKLTELPIADRYSTGSVITKLKLTDAFVRAELQSKENIGNNNISESSSSVVEPIKEEIKEEPKIIIEKLVDVPEVKVEPKKEVKRVKEKVNLKEIDDRLLTIEDFLNSD